MELALYCPVYGFYEKESDTIGRKGHFFTSVSTGRLFGELLAYQFASWIDFSRRHSPTLIEPTLIEGGAHDGRLALDILDGFRQRRPDLYQHLNYSIVESSARRRSWQQHSLACHASKVCWLDALPASTGNAPAIIFSNELLDAFPVHRLVWHSARKLWVEWGVTLTAGNFTWFPLPDISREVRPLLPDIAPDVLPDGYVIEISPAALDWWSRASAALGRGFLVTFDYGFSAEDRFAPERTGGTLRAYRAHRVIADVLSDPGEQDLTAHVDFAAVQQAGEAAGLRTIEWTHQGRFLSRIAAAAIVDGVQWDSARIRQLNSLTHPEHLGATFKVLVQSRP